MKVEHLLERYVRPATIETTIKIERDKATSVRNAIHSNLLCFAGLE